MTDDDPLFGLPGTSVPVRESVVFAAMAAFKQPIDRSITDPEEKVLLRLLAVLQAATPMLHADAQEGIADCLEANNFNEAAKAVRSMKEERRA